MNASPTRRLFGPTFLLALLAGASSCGPPPVRIPLAVPLSAVGGSRPATPQGLQLIGEFGDGVWGQEQERVEIGGAGLGFALRDRVEFSVSGYGSTRQVESQTGEATAEVRGKVRFGDFGGGRASVGLHVAYMGSQRQRFGVQDERMTAWDIALPLEFYPKGTQFVDHRWGLYVAPRLVFQTFQDRMTNESKKGTMAGALLGVAGRWRHFAITGEMNIVRTPTMSFSTTTFQGGWLALPMASVRGILPIGD